MLLTLSQHYYRYCSFAGLCLLSVGEIDFWLLWLLAMIVVSLPVVYAEVALAYRSVDAPLAGMQKLTREADASPVWRSFGWLAALVSFVIAALVVSGVSTKVS